MFLRINHSFCHLNGGLLCKYWTSLFLWHNEFAMQPTTRPAKKPSTVTSIRLATCVSGRKCHRHSRSLAISKRWSHLVRCFRDALNKRSEWSHLMFFNRNREIHPTPTWMDYYRTADGNRFDPEPIGPKSVPIKNKKVLMMCNLLI